MKDVIIIGGGAAGASAALYCCRGGLDTLVITNGRSALVRAKIIENYYGTGRISGAELYARGIEQAKSVGAEIIDGEVIAASFDGHFEVKTVSAVYRSRRLILATGAARKSVDIAGIEEFEGKGVHYCAVCDAFFYRKKKVAVLGAGEFAKHELETLAAVASHAVLLTNGEKTGFTSSDVIDKRITRFFGGAAGSDHIGGAEFDDGSRVEFDGLFVAVGVMGAADIAKSMGVMTDASGSIAVDGRGMTNIPGLYAAGDCTAGIRQISKAACDGMICAMDAIKELKKGVPD